MSALTNRIDHVAIAANDADAVARWYEALGMRVVLDEVVPGRDRILFLVHDDDPSTTALQIITPAGPGPLADHLAAHGEGLHHVCFATDDIPAVLAALGDTVTEPFAGGRGRPCAFPSPVPAGARLELVEIPR